MFLGVVCFGWWFEKELSESDNAVTHRAAYEDDQTMDAVNDELTHSFVIGLKCWV